MNRNVIRLAVAALLPLATSSVWALSPTVTQGISAANTIYLSGSTAFDTALQAFFELDPAVDSRAPCAANTLDIYKSSSGYLMSCTTTAAFTGAPNTNIVVAKQTAGGSAIGISNVTRATSTPGYTDKSTLVANSGAAVNTPAASPFASFNTIPVTSTEVSLAPNAGISDLDPTTFVGTGGVTSADASALTVVHGLQQPFGIIVSKDLFNRLQVAEGLGQTDDFANVPSLTSQQLRSILSGQIIDWGDVYAYDKATHTVATRIGNGATSGVHICRRGNTSGTELGSNVYFFSAGCSKGSNLLAISAPDTPGNATNGVAWNSASDPTDFVFAGSGTGDVKKCVASTIGAGDTLNYRIGFVGTDNKSTAAAGDVWRFIAIDEQPGTLYSILQGRYGYLTEDTLNSTTASLAQGGGLGLHGAIWNYITGNVGNRVAIAGYNAKFQGAWDLAGGGAIGDSGVLTLGKPTGNADALNIPLTTPTWPNAVRSLTAGSGPASTVTRGPTSGVTNNCNNVQVVNPIS